jgi:hypothetical protein
MFSCPADDIPTAQSTAAVEGKGAPCGEFVRVVHTPCGQARPAVVVGF